MRRFPPLFTTTKAPPPPPPSPNVPLRGPHSDALWKLYKELVETDPSSSNNSNTSGVYYTTDTILDLDADNSPATRPYTSAAHQKQIEKWGTNHTLIALTNRMHTFRDEISDAKLSWKRKLGPFDERRITERDILVMALLGPCDGSKSQRWNGNGQLSHEFLQRIGIFKRIAGDGIPLTVRYLVHRVKTQRSQGRRQVEAQTQTQTVSSRRDDQLGSTDTSDEDASESISTGTDTTSVKTTGQETKQPKTKTKTKAQEIKHLKSVLRKSNAQSIPRVLYPLLNDNHGRTLTAECYQEIISGMSRKPTTQSVPDPHTEVQTQTELEAKEHEHEATIRATIFLKNLAYNLLTKGNLVLSLDLTSAWSKVLDQPQGTPLATNSTATEAPRPSTGNITPDVDVLAERALADVQDEQHLREEAR